MFCFRLYIAGNATRSRHAVQSLMRLAERHLPGTVRVEIIDVYQETERAKADHVIAVPTLIRLRPQPTRRVLGDFSDERSILLALAIDPEVEEPPA